MSCFIGCLILLFSSLFPSSGNLDLAKKAFERVLELDPKQTHALVSLAVILFHEGSNDSSFFSLFLSFFPFSFLLLLPSSLTTPSPSSPKRS